ncbi:MAG: SCO family protein [Burkholderiaceae bacterium]|nr:SCO family protein [Burkholderiaceae bacterium]
MLRTALASCLALVLAWAAAAWLTHDFRVFTAEGARRIEVRDNPVAAPSMQVAGPGIGAIDLAALLKEHGGPTIVDFVYTRCVSVCAALGSGFQQLQRRIVTGDAARSGSGDAPVRLLSVSFDPEHDDVAALARYARDLQADPGIWRFVTVPDATALERLLRAFRVVVIPDGFAGYEHNAALLVVDADARLVRVFDYDELDEALHFARSLPAAKTAWATQ